MSIQSIVPFFQADVTYCVHLKVKMTNIVLWYTIPKQMTTHIRIYSTYEEELEWVYSDFSKTNLSK